MKYGSEAPRGDQQPKGRYANYFKVGYNAFEFVFDFGQSHPESDEAQFNTRIVTSPSCAKALLETMRDSINQYERSFGSIPGEEDAGELKQNNRKKSTE